MFESPESLKAVTTIENTLSDIRVNPDVVAKYLTTKSEPLQEKVFLLSLAIIRELAIQAKTGGYVNGNMDIAHQALEIQETVLTFQTQP